MSVRISSVGVVFDICLGAALTIAGVPLMFFLPPVGITLLSVGLGILAFGLIGLACGCASAGGAPGSKSLFSRIFGGEEKSEPVNKSKGPGLLARMFGGKTVEPEQTAKSDLKPVHSHGFTMAGKKVAPTVVKVVNAPFAPRTEMQRVAMR